jgi:transcriptional regulator with XRE-family HTH domain
MKYNIKVFREAKGMTQQDLADKAGCSRQFVNMLENSDEINVSTKVLVSIANALERTVDDLIFFEQ